jgi:hypothetical protein
MSKPTALVVGVGAKRGLGAALCLRPKMPSAAERKS